LGDMMNENDWADKNLARVFFVCGFVIAIGIVVHHYVTGFNGIW